MPTLLLLAIRRGREKRQTSVVDITAPRLPRRDFEHETHANSAWRKPFSASPAPVPGLAIPSIASTSARLRVWGFRFLRLQSGRAWDVEVKVLGSGGIRFHAINILQLKLCSRLLQ